MKNIKLCIVAASLFPALAFAAPSANTINFQGEVTKQTCSVSVNGNAKSPTVLLPTVADTALSSAGSVAGQTAFTIALSGCTAPVGTSQAVNTVFVGNNVTADGNLGNSGTATNVALQLLDPAGTTPFDLSGVNGYSAAGLVIDVGQTSASHDFAVRYISEQGSATPGSVLGSVQYAVSYI